MSERIVQLNEEVIKELIKELAWGSVEGNDQRTVGGRSCTGSPILAK